MSFTADMIASLKNNKRNRVSTFDKVKNFKKGGNIEVSFDKKATPQQLKNIREKLQSENKRVLKKKVIIFIVLMLIIIYVIGFVKF